MSEKHDFTVDDLSWELHYDDNLPAISPDLKNEIGAALDDYLDRIVASKEVAVA